MMRSVAGCPSQPLVARPELTNCSRDGSLCYSYINHMECHGHGRDDHS